MGVDTGKNPGRIREESGTNPGRIRDASGTNPGRIRDESGTKSGTNSLIGIVFGDEYTGAK